jgi:hypothetical protein
MKQKKWLGDLPNCDVCGKKPVGFFVDGMMRHGTTWAVMCPACFQTHGRMIGQGFGQKYDATTLEKVKG